MAKPKVGDLLKDGPAKEREPSAVEKILGSAKEIGGAMWDAATPMVAHGSTELMSGIYSGSAFVPYGWGSVDTPGEPSVEPPKTPDVERERGGLEL